MDDRPTRIVVDEEGKLMNYLVRVGSGKGDSPLNIIRPFAYYCFTCETCVLFPERVNMNCDACGEHRFIRAVVANGDVMWIK